MNKELSTLFAVLFLYINSNLKDGVTTVFYCAFQINFKIISKMFDFNFKYDNMIVSKDGKGNNENAKNN